MRKQASVAQNFIYNSILTVTNVLFPLIIFPYASRMLLVEAIGKVDFATAVVNYFIMFASLGIPTYGIRACARVREDKEKLSHVTQELLIISIITTGITCLVFVLSILYIPKFALNRSILIINGCSLLLNAFGMNWLYSGLEQYKYITIRSVVFKGIALLSVFLMVRNPNDYLLYAGISVFSVSGANILNFVHSRKLISFKKQGTYDLKQHMKPIFTFFATSIAVSIYTNLDIVMLGFISGDTQVGYYSAAMKIRSAAAAFVTSLGTVLLPRFSLLASEKKLDEYKGLFKQSLKFTIFSALPLTVFFVICAQPSIVLLAGKSFSGATATLQILIPTVLIAGLTNVTGTQLLVPWGKENKLLFSIICGAVLDFLANLITIPLWGAAGAAFSTLLAEITVLIVQSKVSYGFLREQIKGISVYKNIIAVFISSVAVLLFENMCELQILVFMISGCAIFGIIYVGVLWIFKDEFLMQLIDKGMAFRKRG
ncbi:MAG: flippase [Lachnospiraceae bacterium]|nr:flippase [Lachnospiraceae bacterium]